MDRKSFILNHDKFTGDLKRVIEILLENRSSKLWDQYKIRTSCNFSIDKESMYIDEIKRVGDYLATHNANFNDLIDGYLTSIWSKFKLAEANNQKSKINYISNRTIWLDNAADDIFSLLDIGFELIVPVSLLKIIDNEEYDLLEYDIEKLFDDDIELYNYIIEVVDVLAHCNYCEDLSDFLFYERSNKDLPSEDFSISYIFDLLRFSYPYEFTTMYLISQYNTSINRFKKGILGLKSKPDSEDCNIQLMLKRLKNLKERVEVTDEEIKLWCEKYNVNLDDILAQKELDSKIYNFLNDDLDERSIVENKTKIQYDFYNYVYGLMVNELIDFLSPFALKRGHLELTFDSLFTNNKDLELTLSALEELAITRKGKSCLTQRTKSRLRGVIEALKQEYIIPSEATDTLCQLFAVHIGMEYKARLKDTDSSIKAKKDTITYIKQHR